ncbi:MAG TPA: DUF3857 and transglutaminase domain-containing protein [Terriglobales bacterium]
MTSLSQQPGAPAVILAHEENDDDTMHYRSVYVRLKVLTDAGREYANVEIPYDRGAVNIGDVSGRTVHADGSIVPLTGKPFDKTIVKGHGLRYNVKSFTLPDVQVGSILEYRYSIRYADNVAMSPRWLVQGDLFQKNVSYKFIPYKRDLILEHGRIGNGVAWSSFLPKEYAPKLQETPLTYWVELHANDVPALTKEPYMFPEGELKYRVEFYYKVSVKQDEYWKEEGKYWNKDVESFIGHDKGIREAVAQTVTDSDSPEMKARKIYTFVEGLENQSYIPSRATQETRAIGLRPNEGVDDVLRQRSGEPDELTRLFAAMARAAGIPAHLMRVPRRDENFFHPEFLSTDQFDAEIAIIELGGKEVFLDPGTKYCPYGLLDWRHTNIGGLRQSATKGTEIGRTPLNSYNQALTQRIAHLKPNEDGRVEGSVFAAFYGIEAMNRRREGGRTDAEGRKRMLEDEVRSWLPGGSEVTLTKDPQWEGSQGALIAEFNISAPLAVSAGKRWLVPAHIFHVNDKPRFASAQRTNVIYFDYPSRESDEVHITLPPNMEVESVPPKDDTKLDFALYHQEQKMESANSLLAVRDVIMNGLAFPPNVYKEVKDFYDKVKTGDDQQVLLKGATHVAAN